MSPAAASGAILGRLPRHLDAQQPGKLIGAVVDALASELEVATIDLGRVRQSRRLAEAAELADLLLLAGLHGIEGHALELLRQRLAAAAEIGRIAGDASLGDARAKDAFDRLPDALGLPADSFPRWTGESSSREAGHRLAAALTTATAHASLLRLLRTGIESVVALHRRGNGTVGALLGAAANALQLDVEQVSHSVDRYWHVARARDRLRVSRPSPPGTLPAAMTLSPEPDVVVLEENPSRPVTVKPEPLRHGGRLTVPQRGYETVRVTVRVVGIAGRTVAPMVVNLDTGIGLAFVGSLADGQELVYAATASGTSATVAGRDEGSRCYRFQGGVFADADDRHVADFVFTDAAGRAPGRDNAAVFARTEPAGAFDHDDPLPARNADLGPVVMPPGAARWALFVGAATFGGDGEAGRATLASPLLLAARFGRSVFDPERVDNGVDPDPVGAVGLNWLERRPFTAVLWLPTRFASLGVAGQPAVADRVARLLDRHRAAGVRVDVRHADDALADRLAAAFAGSVPV